jgi:hypothetical protein
MTTQQPATATELWEKLVSREVAAGKTKMAAVRAVDKSHPGLRSEMCDEVTAANRRR